MASATPPVSYWATATAHFRPRETSPLGPSPIPWPPLTSMGTAASTWRFANSGSDYVSVLLGNGDGTFQARRNFAAGTGPASVAGGDFNGDGRLDLAVANSGGD